ncbi:MAG: hypothetical protein ACTHMV_16880 [Chitinophagaceae bacterium]
MKEGIKITPKDYFMQQIASRFFYRIKKVFSRFVSAIKKAAGT